MNRKLITHTLSFIANTCLSSTSLLAETWLGMNYQGSDNATYNSQINNANLNAIRTGGNSSGSNLEQTARVNGHVAQGYQIHWSINYRGNSLDPAGTNLGQLGALDINGSTMQTWFNNYKSRCQQIMTSYRGKVEYYIVGNEPDLPYDNYSGIPGRPDIATKLTQAMWEAAQAVKAQYPGTRIIVESSPTSSPDTTYLRDMIKTHDVWKYCDVIGTHVYSDQIEDWRLRKPWEWLAEDGATGVGVVSSESGVSRAWKPASYSGTSQQWQSDYFNMWYVKMKAFGYRYGIMFSRKDAPTGWGLLDGSNPIAAEEIRDYISQSGTLVNGGFEANNRIKSDWVVDWNVASGNWTSSKCYFDDPGARSGSRALRIDTSSITQNKYVYQVIENLTPGVPVSISSWIRVENSNSYAGLSLMGFDQLDGDKKSTTGRVSPTSWQQYELTVTPTNPWVVVRLAGIGDSQGDVWFDDISVSSGGTSSLASSNDTYLRRSDGTANGTQTEILVKAETGVGNNERLGLISFDVSGLSLPVSGATLKLSVLDLGGNYSFKLLGVKESNSDEAFFETSLHWNNSALTDSSDDGYINSETIDLGDFFLTSGESVVTLSSQALTDFLNADTNGRVSLMLRRWTNASAVSRFASKEHGSAAGPVLEVTGGARRVKFTSKPKTTAIRPGFLPWKPPLIQAPRAELISASPIPPRMLTTQLRQQVMRSMTSI